MILLPIDDCPECGKQCLVVMVEIPTFGKIREQEFINEFKNEESVVEVRPTLSYIFLEYSCTKKKK